MWRGSMAAAARRRRGHDDETPADEDPAGPKAPRDRRNEERTALDPASLAEAILDHVEFTEGRPPRLATPTEWYGAAAHAVRDRLLQRWIATLDTLHRREVKVVSYLSAEFLMGPHLGNNLVNLGIRDAMTEAIERLDIGMSLDELLDQEEEPGLGNGGLGRLAACFLESLATLEIPAIGYGIRYEFGIFDQEIRDGAQVEITDKWLRFGNPWEIARPALAAYVGFGGRSEWATDRDGRHRATWIPERVVKGIPYDTPVAGYRVHTTNVLRLWRAEACESFDFQAFNKGDYLGAVDQKLLSETSPRSSTPTTNRSRASSCGWSSSISSSPARSRTCSGSSWTRASRSSGSRTCSRSSSTTPTPRSPWPS